MFAVDHIDKINDDQPAQVSQAQLPGDFLSSFEIGLEAVSSTFRLLEARPELTSMVIMASVGLMIRYPPDFRSTRSW